MTTKAAETPNTPQPTPKSWKPLGGTITPKTEETVVIDPKTQALTPARKN